MFRRVFVTHRRRPGALATICSTAPVGRQVQGGRLLFKPLAPLGERAYEMQRVGEVEI